MKTIIAKGGPRGEIIAEVAGGREEAIEHLVSRRMMGSFLLLCTDRHPGRIDTEWLLIAKANSREASVSYASCPQVYNWAYLDHFPFPLRLREIATDAVQALRTAISEPPQASQQIHREAISDSMDVVGPKPKRRA
jgi:hypothetical protein